MFYHVFCINRKETINTFFFKKSIFSVQPLRLVSSLWLTLLNLLLNSLPISIEGPLNCIWAHGTIKVNVFIQKNIDHIYNYVQKSFSTAEKCPNTEFFSGPQGYDQKRKLFPTNSFVLAHSSAKKFYIEQLTVKSSIQWYHMTLIWHHLVLAVITG